MEIMKQFRVNNKMHGGMVGSRCTGGGPETPDTFELSKKLKICGLFGKKVQHRL